LTATSPEIAFATGLLPNPPPGSPACAAIVLAAGMREAIKKGPW
jgi:hypothetical protein